MIRMNSRWIAEWIAEWIADGNNGKMADRRLWVNSVSSLHILENMVSLCNYYEHGGSKEKEKLWKSAALRQLVFPARES